MQREVGRAKNLSAALYSGEPTCERKRSAYIKVQSFMWEILLPFVPESFYTLLFCKYVNIKIYKIIICLLFNVSVRLVSHSKERKEVESFRPWRVEEDISEIKCRLDATDDFYCRSYCLLNMFRAPLCPSSGAREYYYYTSGCCLSYLVLGFQVVGMVWSWGLCVRFAGCCAVAVGPLWQCGSIRLVRMYGFLCGEVCWNYAATLP